MYLNSLQKSNGIWTRYDKIDEKNKLYFADVPKSTNIFVNQKYLNSNELSLNIEDDSDINKLTLDQAAKLLDKNIWFTAKVKEGTKGPIMAEFAFFRAFSVRDKAAGPEVWVIIRRTLDEKAECKFFLCNASDDTPVITFVNLSGRRWPIETIFGETKGEVGLDHYETRIWIGWNHHMTLCKLAHYFLIKVKNILKDDALALTPQQARLLLKAILPQKKLNVTQALEFVEYYQKRNYAVWLSHRKATIRRNKRQGVEIFDSS